MTSSAFCPGKLILSGEHAVVHGRPALAIPVSKGVTCHWTPSQDPVFELQLASNPAFRLSFSETQDLAEGVLQRHQNFLQGEGDISSITSRPEDLLFTALHLAAPFSGGRLQVQSDLPLGSGMGSSAACLIGLFRSLRPDWTNQEVFEKALMCEHLQHGRSSGLDVAVCESEQPIWAFQGTFAKLPDFKPPAFALYHSGSPQSSTGECVTQVGTAFPRPHPIWDEFEAVTHQLKSGEQLTEAIRVNHQLLTSIGVVPTSIASAIAEIEAHGGAAKICGAGSITGQQAGVILVQAPADTPLPKEWRLVLHQD